MNNNFKNAWIVLRILIVVSALYLIISTIYISQVTGQLKLTSSDKASMLVISQSGHEAKIIGTGHAKIHLKPGVYEVSASTTNAQATSVVKITKKQTTTSSLVLTNAPKLPSPENINFSGLEQLINNGLTIIQVNSLKQAFFNYTPKAHSITIRAIKPVPHNRYSTSGFDTINFAATIDGRNYSARVDYFDLTVVELYLTNPQTGAQVFDSNPVGKSSNS